MSVCQFAVQFTVRGHRRSNPNTLFNFNPVFVEISSLTDSALQRVDFCSHLAITYQRTEYEHFLTLVHLPGILFQNICGHLI